MEAALTLAEVRKSRFFAMETLNSGECRHGETWKPHIIVQQIILCIFVGNVTQCICQPIQLLKRARPVFPLQFEGIRLARAPSQRPPPPKSHQQLLIYLPPARSGHRIFLQPPP